MAHFDEVVGDVDISFGVSEVDVVHEPESRVGARSRSRQNAFQVKLTHVQQQVLKGMLGLKRKGERGRQERRRERGGKVKGKRGRLRVRKRKK